MVVSKRRECKAVCEKDRRNKIATQISLIAKAVPQDLLPPGFSQKDVLVAAYKFILSATNSTSPSCSKSGRGDEQLDDSACLKQLSNSATHVTYVITTEPPSKPVLTDQFAQTEACEFGLVNSCPVQPNYVIMVQPTVLVDSTKKRKIDSRPAQSTHQLLPKPSPSAVIDGGDILSQAAAAILSENQESQTDIWPVPPEVASVSAQTEETPIVTQNAGCQTAAVNISENFQDIVDMVEESNRRQADAQFANRQKQPSGTGLRVENLLAPTYDRPTQQHPDPNSSALQRPPIWSQYPNFAVSSFNGQQEQTSSAATNDASVINGPVINAHPAARPNTTNVQQSGGRFTVDFSVAGVLRTDDASTSQVDQRSKLTHFANSEQRHSQQRQSQAHKQAAKRQTTQNRQSRQNTDKGGSSCTQASTTFIQPSYYPAAHQHPPLDATGERVDLSEDIFDYAAPTMDGNNWWYQRPAQAAQFWTNNSNSGIISQR
uniref:BHLH domain-containing protein n=1 Tax=Plectus sambesii TaxID=2011161 RepID=A0A914WVY5_9BILA